VVPTAAPAKPRAPKWGPLQPNAMKGPGDLGGWQRWSIDRDLSSDVVTLVGDREESQKLDAETTMINRHTYRVSVQKSRPGLARSIAKQEAIVSRPVGATVVATTVIATTHELSIEADIRVDGELVFTRRWKKTRKAKKR
jgi:hypothetical protein